MDEIGTHEQRAVLVGAGPDREMGELERLAETLGLQVTGVLEQNRRDGSGYLGRGKRGELRDLVEQTGAGLVVADDELTSSQARVLEGDAGDATVVDRTLLIIRIFEAHARDAASRLEVELAELTYRLPRVRGGYRALSRLGGGGVTTRGPGEQQLEYDRRAIRERMRLIRKKLDDEKSARVVRGARLKDGGPPTVALVGYTNAGKTTILNALSGARRSTKDRLFETLETTTRLVESVDGADGQTRRPSFVVTDTVGFIKKLPTQLVHSFAATLEVARDADVRVICADAGGGLVGLSNELGSVTATLAEADISADDAILCLNKIDLLTQAEDRDLEREYPSAVRISAKRSVLPLAEAIQAKFAAGYERARLLFPHADFGEAAKLYGTAEIHAEKSTNEGLYMDVTLPSRLADRYARFALTSN